MLRCTPRPIAAFLWGRAPQRRPITPSPKSQTPTNPPSPTTPHNPTSQPPTTPHNPITPPSPTPQTPISPQTPPTPQNPPPQTPQPPPSPISPQPPITPHNHPSQPPQTSPSPPTPPTPLSPISPQPPISPHPPLDLAPPRPFSHCSPTELLRAALVLRLCAMPGVVRHSERLLLLSRRLAGRRLWEALLRRTLYAHFVGGDSAPLWAEAVRRLRAVGIGPMLALPMEHRGTEPGEPWFEQNRGAALLGVGLAGGAGPGAMMQLKVTALMGAELCNLVSQRLQEPHSDFSVERIMAVMGGQPPSFASLTADQNRALGAGLQRLEHVAAAAAGSGVGLLLDAEQSELGPALRLWALGLMGRHNTGLPRVWHTHQAYLKGAEARLHSDLQSARRMGAPYGLKLVRGAYLHHERLTGALQPSREHTDRSYAACLELALQHVSAGHVALVVATHNADSVRQAARRMEELRIPRDGPVCFAQLQGVGEHLGLALGRAGFRALRSVPYGPPEAVLPYLARRAQEHPELPGSAQQRAELSMEIRRRLLPWGGGS